MRIRYGFLLLLFSIAFMLAQPSITGIAPDSVYQGEVAAAIMINGGGFVNPVSVEVAGTGVTVSDVTFLLSSMVRVLVDVDIVAPVGYRDFIVTNPDGLADTLRGEFYVANSDTIPPEVTMVFPECDDTIACADSAIIFDLDDVHGFIHASIMLSINGTAYGISDPELTIVDDTLVVWRPLGMPLTNPMNVSFINVFDSLGYGHDEAPVTCTFYVDTLGPTVSDEWPPAHGSTREFTPLVSMRIHDAFSGIDSSSIVVRVNGVEYSWPHASLEFDGDTLRWDASDAGAEFFEWDTVHVCIMNANDRVFGPCGPNGLEEDSVCWFFRIVVPPPEELSLRIASINSEAFPYIKALCEVYDEEGRTIEHLNQRNFMVWERDGTFQREYPIIVQDLGGGGLADIVFVIDDTGSMGGMITAVRDACIEFADSLSVSDINYRLGLVTFKDATTFPRGYDLTADISEFRTWVGALTASGGGDGPETSLDAMYDAIDSLHFRAGSRIVEIMVTDYGPHWLGDGTTYSDVLPYMVVDHLLDAGAIAFCIQNTSWRPLDTNFVYIAEATDGVAFGYDPADPSGFLPILDQIVEEIRGGYYVSWTSHDPVADCRIRDTRILAAYPNIYDTGDPGYLDDFDVIEYQAPCSPDIMIVEPLPETFTSCSDQQIILDFSELSVPLDSNSIQLVVDGVLYTIDSPELSYSDPRLIFEPMAPDTFVHHQTILVNLARAMNVQGHFPYHGPVIWEFNVDLVGPEASNPQPEPLTQIADFQPEISFDIEDDFAGIHEGSILVAIDSREIHATIPPDLIMLDVESEGVSWDGETFSWDPSVAGVTFMEWDTVCVSIVRAYDNIDYCDYNSLNPEGLVDWCFYIPDEDTICPEFENFAPEYGERLDALVPFHLSIDINDPSDVYDDNTGSDGQGVYVWWDDDGDVFDGTYNEIQMSSTDGVTFTTDVMVPGQSETADFAWSVFAYDNDFELEAPDDRTGCFSEMQFLIFGIGPIATVIEPLDHTVSTVPNQSIYLEISDDESVIDETTVEIDINGVRYTVADDELIFDHALNQAIFTPDPEWPDGDTVYVSLIRARDVLGLPCQNYPEWQFFVDHSEPYVVPGSNVPGDGAITLDFEQLITLELVDDLRDVNPDNIIIAINSDTFSTTSAELSYNGEILEFDPSVSEYVFPNGDSICVRVLFAEDSPVPDYGTPNVLDPEAFSFCFLVSVTNCDHTPSVLTPNGDTYNDVAHFTYPNMAYGNGVTKIYNLRHVLVWESERGVIPMEWDGRDNHGNVVSPGLYVYNIIVDGESVCNGTITVVR